jgi:hypothetical protein
MAVSRVSACCSGASVRASCAASAPGLSHNASHCAGGRRTMTEPAWSPVPAATAQCAAASGDRAASSGRASATKSSAMAAAASSAAGRSRVRQVASRCDRSSMRGSVTDASTPSAAGASATCTVNGGTGAPTLAPSASRLATTARAASARRPATTCCICNRPPASGVGGR